MRSRLRLEELSEGRMIDVAEEGGLETDGLEAHVEEPSRAALGAGALLAPGFPERGSVEREVKGEIVGDGKRRSLIEVGDEVGRDRRFAGVPAHRVPDHLDLLVDPVPVGAAVDAVRRGRP